MDYIEELEELIEKYGEGTTLIEAYKLCTKDTEEYKPSSCYNCDNKICIEKTHGDSMTETFKCIKGNCRIDKSFTDLEECHEWHHKHWMEVVMRG